MPGKRLRGQLGRALSVLVVAVGLVGGSGAWLSSFTLAVTEVTEVAGGWAITIR